MPLDRDDRADPIRSLLPNAIRSGFETLAESDRERRTHGGDPAGPRAEPIPVPAELGRYRVIDEIGRGGVGVVYRAIDPETGRTLALKVLRPRHAASAEAIERFRTEAGLCAALDHPGIVPVYEVGTFADGRPYYTMRLIAGSTLRAEIRTAPRHRLLAQFADVCEVIAHAHRRGIVHGDLKPSNVLIGGSGEVQVVDWSFTTALGPAPADGGAVGPRPIIGTPGYIAPERLRGRGAAAADARADVFALGAILVDILTASLGDADEDGPKALRARLSASGAEPALVDLAVDCLAADPDRRPGAAAVAERVLLHIDGVEQRARRLELSTAVAEAKARLATRVRSLTLALAFCAVLLCALLAWFEIGRRERQHEESALVRRAAGQVSQLVEEARRSPLEAVLRWDEAHRMVRSAVESVRDRRHDDPVRREIEELAVSVAAGREAAHREREVIARLDAIRDHHAADIAGATLRADFRAVFAHFGLSLEPGDLEADVARIRRSSIAERLGIALDQYGLQLSRAPRDEAALRPHLRALAARADPDPLRLKLRAAITDDDAEALLRAIRQADLERAQPATFDLAASHLEAVGRPTEAIALYRRGRRLHPSDFVLNHELARMLRSRPDRDPREELILMASTVAIHPSSPHTWTDFAVVAFQCGLPAIGEDALDRALELDPEYSRALAWRGKRMSKDGDRHAAMSLLVRAVASEPSNFPAWNSLGALLSWEGFVADAATCFERALRLEPHDAAIQTNLGLERLKLRDPNGALPRFREATRLRGDSPTLLCSTGYALLLDGQFDAARDAMERGHELSRGDPTWDYPSAAWLARIRSAAEVAHARGAGEPAPGTPASDLVDQAWVAGLGGDRLRAIDLYRRAEANDPAVLWSDAWIAAEHPWQDIHLTWAITAALGGGAAGSGDEAGAELSAHREPGLRWLGLLLDGVEADSTAPQPHAASRRDLLHRLDHLLRTGPADAGFAAARARIAHLLEVLSAEFPIRLPG